MEISILEKLEKALFQIESMTFFFCQTTHVCTAEY